MKKYIKDKLNQHGPLILSHKDSEESLHSVLFYGYKDDKLKIVDPTNIQEEQEVPYNELKVFDYSFFDEKKEGI